MRQRRPGGAAEPLLKRRDVILALCLLLFAGVLALVLYVTGLTRGTADRVEISVDGELYGTYSLLENQEIKIETESGYNLLIIENGSAHMEEADCPDGYCMDQGSISRNGQSIVCLPHKVVVSAVSSDGSDAQLDGVAQ